MTRRLAHPRSSAAILADLVEVQRMVRQIAARYPHALDLAYSQGSGSVAAGGSRGAISEANPTEQAALGGGDAGRAHVAAAGRAVQRMVDQAHTAHAELVKAMPGSDPYEPVHKPSAADQLATRAERAQTAERQRQRISRGEL